MTTFTSSTQTKQTLQALATSWCAQGYQGRSVGQLDHTPSMTSVFAITLNPEAPQ